MTDDMHKPVKPDDVPTARERFEQRLEERYHDRVERDKHRLATGSQRLEITDVIRRIPEATWPYLADWLRGIADSLEGAHTEATHQRAIAEQMERLDLKHSLTSDS